MATITDLLEVVDQCFNKNQLEQIFSKLIKPAVEAKPEMLSYSPGFARYYDSLNATGNRPKGLFVGLMAGLYSDPETLKAFLRQQPEIMQKVMEALVWRGAVSAPQIQQEWDVMAVTNGGKQMDTIYWHASKQEPDLPFLFFPNNSSQAYRFDRVMFFFPFELRKTLQDQFPRPRDYDLMPAKPVYGTDYVYEDQGRVFTLLSLIDMYHRQGNIKLTQSGKPQASTLSKMQKALRIDEFFEQHDEEKLFKSLRTHLLTTFCLELGHEETEDPIERIRKLFAKFENGAYNSVYNLLIHLKGTGHIYDYKQKHVESHLLDLLRKMPPGSWVDAEGFHNWFLYRGIELRPVSLGDASHSLYISSKGEYGQGRDYIEHHTYADGVLKPYIKGTFFLFAALGLVDIAYDVPDTREQGNSWYSPFDGLKYVRMTDFGAYIAGLRESYIPPASTPTADVVLSEDALLIRLDGDQEAILPILENYARRLSSNRFKVDYESFLKGCNDLPDIETKIRLFEEQVCSACPDIWHVFFSEVRRKARQMKPVKDTLVFRLHDTDRDLAALIARDEVLKALVVKAEGYHIILNKRDLPKFKGRLKGFGYLI